ncbi:hypothetical protein TIFTF001_009581 [Ficus carica]|uniref:Uncharacterized protein n=1 Tax=Ficus carica TaxID=3494 RepID=A0AA88CZ31_FICCA|nr:hypothetical protein TIFTF001_009581 [Ficus carica]
MATKTLLLNIVTMSIRCLIGDHQVHPESTAITASAASKLHTPTLLSLKRKGSLSNGGH